MKRIAFYSLLLIVFTFSFAYSKIKVDFEGYGSTGFSIYNTDYMNQVNNLAYYRGKLQTEIEYNDRIKAQLDFRGESENHSITFKEFSIRFKFVDYLWLKVGNIKKPFGHEQITNRENLKVIERSFAHEQFSNIGYGGRAVSIMAYYEYDDKVAGPPISYYISGFKENSLNAGVSTRFVYHYDNMAYALNYLYLSNGSLDYTSNGFAFDFTIDKKRYITSIELLAAQDPVEGIIRRLHDRDDIVWTLGAKWLTAYKFKFKKDFMDSVEPLIQFSYFVPDSKVAENNVIQLVLGCNYYFYKDVMLRFNGDIRLTKNEYIGEYDPYNSRATIEIFVTF
jgi:hypothetical protein